MTTLLAEVGTSLTIAAFAAFASVVVAVINRRGRTENELIDQLQEERLQLQAERAELLERLAAIEHRERLRDDYLRELRDHIDQRRPPPPPPWPDETSRAEVSRAETNRASVHHQGGAGRDHHHRRE